MLHSSSRKEPLKLLTYGDPLLHQVSREVEDPTSERVKALVDHMLITIDALENVGGLAAPQVGIFERIVIGHLGPDAYVRGDHASLIVMINPVFEPIGDEKVVDWEGCFSVPGKLGRVERYKTISYAYQTLTGETVKKINITGYEAKLLQHEIDHLDGILYPQRILNPADFGDHEDMLPLYMEERKKKKEI